MLCYVYVNFPKFKTEDNERTSFQLYWLYNNTPTISCYIVDKNALRSSTPSFPKIFDCLNPNGILPPYSSMPVLFTFRPNEAKEYKVREKSAVATRPSKHYRRSPGDHRDLPEQRHSYGNDPNRKRSPQLLALAGNLSRADRSGGSHSEADPDRNPSVRQTLHHKSDADFFRGPQDFLPREFVTGQSLGFSLAFVSCRSFLFFFCFLSFFFFFK